MRGHKGAHSRIGATDVCPFVPVSGRDDGRLRRPGPRARPAGRRRSSASPSTSTKRRRPEPERRNLAAIRAGRVRRPCREAQGPGLGPRLRRPVFNPEAGATVIGAREFLIAYNINLNTRDRKLANEIALNIRESGRAKRDADGNIVRDESGAAGQAGRPFPARQGRRLVHRGLRHRPRSRSTSPTTRSPRPRRLRRGPRGRPGAGPAGHRAASSSGSSPRTPSSAPAATTSRSRARARACPRRSSSGRPSVRSAWPTSPPSTRRRRSSNTSSRSRPGRWSA